jgi:hypothetical protein
MPLKIVTRIKDMGQDAYVSIQQIDEFVDECISFLTREQLVTEGISFASDIFDLEQARQDALVSKYSLTIQP